MSTDEVQNGARRLRGLPRGRELRFGRGDQDRGAQFTVLFS